MKAIMVMFDSLSRRMLPPYGCQWVHAPNFQRLAQRSVTFDNCYVGSMPCLPARRELHTGRYNFLHRSWGPLEPFDDSMPQLLKQAGVYTHLASDHCHYWEDGGGTYHTRYNTWRFSRGQEGDPFIGQVRDPAIPPAIAGAGGPTWRQEWVNRPHLQRQEDLPQARTFAEGLSFIARNHDADNWFLQIETFDPHPPFFAPQKYRDLYPHEYAGPVFDWPPYRRVRETPEQVEHCRYEYAALISMCDEYLGKVLDAMDRHDLWQDTLLIVNTDHGFLMGEHESWCFCHVPFYDEVAHTPLFVWDPRCGAAGRRRSSLVQTIDLGPTLLEFFGLAPTPDMQGRPLRQTIAEDAAVREAALFGLFGGQVNVTDGRHVYMRGPGRPENRPLHQYTLMPMHMRAPFSLPELRTAELVGPFSFTKGCPVLRIEPHGRNMIVNPPVMPTLLFDLEADPRQLHPIQDAMVEKRMVDHLVRLMKDNNSPAGQYERLGLQGRPH